MTVKKGFIIAIDGPMASGKGTLAPLLAEKLGGIYVDTGIFFRCLALYCLHNDIRVEDKQAVIEALGRLHIQFLDENHVVLNNEDVTQQIRNVKVSAASSKVATIDKVQDEMVTMYRSFCEERLKRKTIVVIEGRNIGTAIFPSADLKIYLTARLAIRAKRRLIQWSLQGITNISMEDVVKDVEERDRRDQQRKKYPLTSNPVNDGYIIVDNSDFSKEETVQVILTEIKKRCLL